MVYYWEYSKYTNRYIARQKISALKGALCAWHFVWSGSSFVEKELGPDACRYVCKAF